MSARENHEAAANQLRKNIIAEMVRERPHHKVCGFQSAMIGGDTPTGYVFVFVHDSKLPALGLDGEPTAS